MIDLIADLKKRTACVIETLAVNSRVSIYLQKMIYADQLHEPVGATVVNFLNKYSDDLRIALDEYMQYSNGLLAVIVARIETSDIHDHSSSVFCDHINTYYAEQATILREYMTKLDKIDKELMQRVGTAVTGHLSQQTLK